MVVIFFIKIINTINTFMSIIVIFIKNFVNNIFYNIIKFVVIINIKIYLQYILEH